MEIQGQMLGESAPIVALRAHAARLIRRQGETGQVVPLLILGETGVGKGLLARALHEAGARRAGPFVSLNCAAIPETLLEAELFGFERGAFTDARHAKPGLVDAADGGTLLLDEVGLLPGPIQAKLLDFLDTRSVRRLGSTRSRRADVWIIAATNADLDEAVRGRTFREDLYHRLAVLTVRVPALRERGDDVLLLADRFLAAASNHGGGPKELSAEAREALRAHSWPGNVRELRNVIERVASLTDDPVVTGLALGLPDRSRRREETAKGADRPVPDGGGDAADRVARTLAETGWNISETARRLGISRNTLRHRIERHRLRPDSVPSFAGPNNLPRHLARFIGREREIETVQTVLGPARLLTLTGAGGVGKTRLAIEVARRSGAFPDGVWYVDLAVLGEASLVPELVRASTNVPHRPDVAPVDLLAAALADKRTLLVLDNCEHLAAACARLAAQLLESAPRLHVLATSRQPLGAAGELVWRVPSLALPATDRATPVGDLLAAEAVRLFADRGSSAQPGFAVTEQNALAVAQICHRLDGLPLAIELAAARLRVLPVQQINARLHERFRLLTAGSSTGLPRHRTLRAAMDWSYDLLSGDERALLRRLSVFAASFSLEAAEAVGGGDAQGRAGMLDLLSQLVEKSLVISDIHGGEARFRLLETVKAYADERMEESGEAAAARARLLEWCMALAERADGAFYDEAASTEQASWLDRLEAEYPNIRACLASRDAEPEAGESRLRLAGAVRRLWWTRGPQGEGREWLERVLAETPPVPSVARGRTLLAAAILARRQGDLERATAYTEEALASYRSLGEPSGLASTVNGLMAIALDRDDVASVARLAQEDIAVEDRRVPAPTRGLRLVHLARASQLRGDDVDAERLATASLALYRDIGNALGEAHALQVLGDIARDLGHLARAAPHLEASLRLFRRLAHGHGTSEVLLGLADVARQEGAAERAATLYGESVSVARDSGFKRGIAAGLHGLGLTARSRGDVAAAARWCGESLALWQRLGSRLGLASCFETLAGLAAERGDGRHAARLLGAAQALRRTLGTPLPPAARAQHSRDLERVRQMLGEPAFSDAWARGEAMAEGAADKAARGTEEIGPRDACDDRR